MKITRITILASCLWVAGGALLAEERAEERERMVRVQLEGRGIKDRRVLEQMLRVPRHRFVPEQEREHAYADVPLPIGYGQTISQPYVVALMTEKLEPKSTDRVLEVGTGSGYQAAVLSGLVAEVHTMEIVAPLARTAGECLRDLGFTNVVVHEGDGYFGLPEKGPFDAIIVTAAAGQIPPPLVQQLKPGGRMVVPVGPAWSVQTLLLVTKDETGRISTRSLAPVRFVSLTGGH
jgi:protein-L-isoaspartate(D-aspartate) O-methyltransferase